MLYPFNITIIDNRDLYNMLVQLSDEEFKVMIYLIARSQLIGLNSIRAFETFCIHHLDVFIEDGKQRIFDILQQLKEKGYIKYWDFQVNSNGFYDFELAKGMPESPFRYQPYSGEDYTEKKPERSEKDSVLNTIQLGRIESLAKDYNDKRPTIDQDIGRWMALKNRVVNIWEACQVCESIVDLELHHKHYRTYNFEGIDDVVLLCLRCHRLLHSMANNKVEQENRNA